MLLRVIAVLLVFSFCIQARAISPVPEGISPEGNGDYAGCLISKFGAPDFKDLESEEGSTEDSCKTFCPIQTDDCISVACYENLFFTEPSLE